MKLIDKSALVAEIEKYKKEASERLTTSIERPMRRQIKDKAWVSLCQNLLSFIDTLEVKEVEETEQRMKECPFRQDVCNRYKGTQVKCDGRCSWVVDYPKLKELKAQKGE